MQTNNNNKNLLHKYSSLLRLNSNGVPLGSILGLLLFLIYINGFLHHFLGINFFLYADNTNILFLDKEEMKLQQKITLVMKQLESWFSINDLTINIDKICATSFHPYQKYQPIKPLITLKNNIIVYKTELKFLGLNITETLTWQAQIHSLSTSLCKSYYLIKSLKYINEY